MTVKLDTEGVRCIGVFESLTGARVKDCVVDNEVNKVTFVVKKGDMGLAIGKNGANINKVENRLRKVVEVVEHSSDLSEFVENLLRPACVKSVELLTKNEKCCACVKISKRYKGAAIGRNGEKIKRAKLLVKRNQNIDNLILV
ncbi:transcription elongation factor NusA [ANME-1 cluster archaeon ex4572_4]|nr:MAG: transcription elongation factor NusA [ANME-1 cluster archaeon ex4572_4]HDN68727.1 NusA-like transcription termination signal-binding factor [Methanomicrobia archaeon]